MLANYEYFYVLLAVGSLDIEDIGNCCILANNDNCEFYYLIIKTDYGMTKLLEYGPYREDMTPQFVNCNYSYFQYNELKIDKLINKFLNDSRKNVTLAIDTDYKDVEERLVSPIKFFNEDI